jgi:hypothetical protein
MSGEVLSLVTPLLAPVVSFAAGAKSIGTISDLGGGNEANILDMDAEKAVPALVQGLGGINGDRIERMLKKLLVLHKNISFDDAEGNAKLLTEDLANEVFCGEAQDMFILAYEVIRANFPGIFKKLGNLFGGSQAVERAKETLTNLVDAGN